MSTKLRRLLCSALLFLAVLVGAEAGRARAATLTFAVGSTNAVTNSQVVVPIRVTNFTGISSFQFSLHWSTAVATFVGVEQFGLPGLTASNFGMTLLSTGTLTAAWDDPDGAAKSLTNGSMAFGVRFQFVGPAAATTPVTIDGFPTAVVAGDENLNSVPVEIVNNLLSIDRTLIVTCAPDKVVECGTPWTFDPPVATDSCGGLPVTINILSTVTNMPGTCGFTATRTWEILDPCTNRTVCVQTVTAIDTTPPVVSCMSDKIIEYGQAWAFDPPAGNDSCVGTNLNVRIVSTVTNAGPCGLMYTATRMWAVADGCSNTVNCTQVVTVRDTTPPVLTCQPDKNINCLGVWSFDAPSATDIADGTGVLIEIVSTVTNGTCGASFSVTRTWRATDSCGNSSTCSQTAFGRAIVTVAGTAFLPTNFPPSMNDKRVAGMTITGPTNTSAVTLSNGTYNLVFDAANNVLVNALAPSAGNPSDGVTTLDITLLRRHILSISSLDTPYKLIAGDVDGSASITTLDLSFMRRLILGVTNKFPKGLWRFVPADYAFTTNLTTPWSAPTNRSYVSVGGDIAGQDFLAIKLGDVNTSWNPPSSVAAPSKKGPASVGGTNTTNGVTFVLPVTNSLPGNEVLVPLVVSQFTNVGTFQFSFHWDPAVVTFLNVEQLGLTGLGAGNFNLAMSNSGTLAVSWDDPFAGVQNLAEGTQLFALRFRATGSPSNTTSLTIDGTPIPFEVTDGFTPVASSVVAGSIYIDQPNRAPVIAAIGAQTVTEGNSLSFTASVSDADGPHQTQTFSLDPGAPAGAAIDPVSGLFAWTPTEAQGPGAYPITIRVTDNGLPFPLSGTALFTVTVEETNAAPQLAAVGDRLGNEGGLLSFQAAATDTDLPAQSLTFSLDPGAPLGASISPGGLFTWTPTEDQGPSTNSITIRVTDNGIPARSASETIVVTIGEANGAPMLTAIGDRAVAESNALAFTVSAIDTDMPSQSIAYSLSNAPAGATLHPVSGQFSWTPTEAQGPGTYVVTVIATDNGSPALSDSETITITVGEVNLAPTLSPIAAQTVNELSPLVFNASGADADAPANVLTYSLSNAPAGATIHPTSGAFSWTPTEAQGSNVYTFFVRVTDNGSPALSAAQSVTVTVHEVLSAPVLAAIGNKAVSEGALLTFTNAATDADLPGQILSFSLSNAPAGASINASNGVFTWTPTEGQGPAVYTVTVIVADDSVPPQADSEIFTITVNEVATAPELAAIGSKSVNEGALLGFTATATDADLPTQTLGFSLSNAPAGASITSAGVFTWTPTEAQGPGVFAITVLVSDGALTDSETISVTVNEVPTAPVLSAIGNRSVNEGVLLTFNAAATDADLPAQALTFTLEGAPAGASITSGGVFTFTPGEAQGPSNYVFTVRVTDSTGQSASEIINVTVNEANIAPTLAAITDKTVVKNTLLSFATPASDVDLPAQALTFSLEPGAPAGASIHPASGVFSWTPTTAQGPSTNSITVRVTDNGPGALSATRTFTVFVSNGNTPPVLAAIGNKQVTTQTELTFTAVATDAESTSQTLTYSLLNAPVGATIHPVAGVFRWTPADHQGPSTNLVTVRVTDNALNPESDEEVIEIVVLEHLPPDITISDTVAPGGTDGTLVTEFVVSLSAPSARPVAVEFTTDDGSGLAGSDYVHTNGLLVFAPGQTNLTVDVQVFGKSTVYTDRTFYVYLFNATNGVIADGTGLGTLDANPAPGLYVSDAELVEGNSGRSNAVFTVTLIGQYTNKVTVNYSAASLSARLRKDFSPKRGRLTFVPGTNTQLISVPVVGELLSESNEVFVVNLSRPVKAVIIQGQGRGTIVDDDPLPEISVGDVSTTEADTGARALSFSLRLSARSGRTITVDFGTSDGTAVAGADYLATNGTIVIPPGFSSKKLSVPILANRTSESNETFFVNLGNPVNARLGVARGAGNIKDNDRSPAASVVDAQVFPGMSGGRFALFTVRLAAPTDRAVTLNVATARDTAVAGTDYVAINESVFFAPGETARTVVVELVDNPAITGKRFYLSILSGVNAVLGDKLGQCVIPAP